ncbi:hypothetical protein WDU94_013273 [Cyamophila willieti]
MSKVSQEEQDQLDWLALEKKIDHGYEHFQQETGSQKFVRKFQENPLVPIGCLATASALVVGLYSMKTGDRKLSQMMMRMRILAQGFTVTCIAGGLVYSAYNRSD